MSKLFLDLLDKNRKDTFSKLKVFSNIGVLGGGTALALQIGHRKSYDFDIFINKKIDKNVWRKSKEVFSKDCIKILENEDQLDLVTPDNIKVTFFNDDYSSLYASINNESIALMDIKDIATNKAFIQGKRPKWRDYVDLYFLFKDSYISLEELIHLSVKKFGTDFSEKLFLEQLVYWDDVGSYQIEFIKTNVEPEEIKTYLINLVKEYKRKIIN
ncbi:hypothetical protein A2422_02490 [Candidatus Woesebacteria bacterium RIFOXYC1_FULL_31_51]|uniref:Nucleotidyl transferase AbiEii/AbiGii toxin family protein n=1 Tax=Candidatus Woesebacteria bacterium GW2011_GWC2_31_9 TaxID=1618586 RepID=A0A0F9YIB3_9BACT|nr:MAG: hypothetical protein UR17_C0001G0002 [Candidatus Woesebacteria bacterium GW2011_GWF1_31_35]KKP23500.1 MAG: hypothetical protein UR11_C0001G0474 [Candidatus Woesebacteria bacterium GW2011_GWC1_30_29]KKP26477.1 MAG: hypothetical protein UR13_C0004G0091 [Candidatus Woesebacteria bacterium GW2011_GWD1_31_12]KKP27776.1 MAG: hypothetical protein UR16_C0002G0106 [Candidatus Woesebacteria bacterium GW2011_GWB1_31_29]KKP31098.1 MAG: hypothetical protein UR21_C0016G0016 [Candidatus Woesebacteria 